MKLLRLLIVAIIFSLPFLLPAAGRAQGCAQCRDNAAAAPPKTQSAYRHAIILLVVTAGSIFLGGVILLRRVS